MTNVNRRSVFFFIKGALNRAANNGHWTITEFVEFLRKYYSVTPLIQSPTGHKNIMAVLKWFFK